MLADSKTSDTGAPQKASETRMSNYVVAVKLASRASIPSDWVDLIRRTEGVQSVTPRLNPHQLTVLASEAAALRIQDSLGDYLFIEPVAGYNVAGRRSAF